jgi:predicted phage tail protein
MNPLDLITGGVSIINKLIEIHKLNEWVKLYGSIFLSYWLSGSFACGTALVSGKGWLFSIGTGMVMGSVMGTVVYRRSSLAKGMTVALPTEEAKTELETNTQVISK